MGFLVNLDNDEIIYPDMIEEEQWSDPSIITEHILEDGGAIADHQRDLPVTCHLKMMVSDSPIEEFDDCANRPAPPSTHSLRDRQREASSGSKPAGLSGAAPPEGEAPAGSRQAIRVLASGPIRIASPARSQGPK
jgi:hypothetical protein